MSKRAGFEPLVWLPISETFEERSFIFGEIVGPSHLQAAAQIRRDQTQELSGALCAPRFFALPALGFSKPRRPPFLSLITGYCLLITISDVGHDSYR